MTKDERICELHDVHEQIDRACRVVQALATLAPVVIEGTNRVEVEAGLSTTELLDLRTRERKLTAEAAK